MTPQKYAAKLKPARLRDIEAAAWWERDNADRNAAEAEIAAVVMANRARPLHGAMRDGEIKGAAAGRASVMADHINQNEARPDWWQWIAGHVEAMGGVPIELRPGVDRAGVLLRYKCPDWWDKQLRKVVVRLREEHGRADGEVCAVRRQVYVSDDTVHRLMQRDKAAREMLERTEIESADGDVVTLAQAADASTANPALRRGELMTRIKGCEVWAQRAGWDGIFTGNTTPSRFHATKHDGKTNPAWTAEGCPTVRDGQAWLIKTWALCRTALGNKGLEVFGFRVAEPHHDGTPHWHMMLWCRPGQKSQVVEVLTRYWLREDADERGAREHRINVKDMLPGMATGYVAKYIAKGIDDQGDVAGSGHVDDMPDGRRLEIPQQDMFGGGANRVRAWARAHGIRQFQGIGQPPVTVWRELRRVDAAEVEQGPGVVREMWDAVNRDGERRACWATYLERQGGACVGRLYRVQVATELREQAGRYETAEKAVPLGVLDRLDELEQVVRSSRKEWKPKGAWANDKRGFDVVAGRSMVGVYGGGGRHGFVAGGGCGVPSVDAEVQVVSQVVLRQGAKPRAAWTRVNNCTGRNEELRRAFAWAFGENGEGCHRAPERSNEQGPKDDPGAHRLPELRHRESDARNT